MIKKVTQVIEGNINKALSSAGILSKPKEAIAAQRRKLCRVCTISPDNKTCSKALGGCGCPIEKIIYSFNKPCPKGNWAATEK